MVINSFGFSDGADPVMRHLKSLKVRACEIWGRQEASRYPVGSKRERRPIEHFFLAFSTYVYDLPDLLFTQGGEAVALQDLLK